VISARNFLRVLTSIRLAVWLLSCLTVMSLLATFVPQGQSAAWYGSHYPPYLALILVRSGFTRFFSSLLLYVPAFLFFVNLSACTVVRLAKELRKRRGRHYGPVLLHLGLMLLVVGAVLSFATRKDGIVYLSKGEQVELTGDTLVTLLDFSFERYPDGRPRDWISTVRVDRGGKTVIGSFSLRVNHPLRLGSTTVYQSSYGSELFLGMRDDSGKDHFLRQGEFVTSGGKDLLFMSKDAESGKAVLRFGDSAKTDIVLASEGDTVGRFTVTGFLARDTSGLQAVQDFGYPFVLVSFVLIVSGVFMTFYRKLGDMEQ